jgi:hypothetical protein
MAGNWGAGHFAFSGAGPRSDMAIRVTTRFDLNRRAVRNRMLALERYALAREILRCAQDDTKKQAAARVILERNLL